MFVFVGDSKSSILCQSLEVIGYHTHRLSLGIWVEDHTKESLAHLNVVTSREGQARGNGWVIPRSDKAGYDKLYKTELSWWMLIVTIIKEQLQGLPRIGHDWKPLTPELLSSIQTTST